MIERVETEFREALKQLNQYLKDLPPAKWPEDISRWDYHGFLEFIDRVTFAFAREAINLVATGAWSADRIDKERDKFCGRFAAEQYRKIGFDRRRNRLPAVTYLGQDELLPDVYWQIFQMSEHWSAYNLDVLAVITHKPEEVAYPPAQETTDLETTALPESGGDDAAAKPPRGRPPNLDRTRQIGAILLPFGEQWNLKENLLKICEQLATAQIPLKERDKEDWAWVQQLEWDRRWVVNTLQHQLDSYKRRMAATVPQPQTRGK